MGTRPNWFIPEELPYESHWIDVDGHEVHYLDVGTGPTLLMLHGNPTWSFLYRRMIAGLSDRFRCVALDYPGFGLSTARSGFGFTATEQAGVVARFVELLDLRDVTPIMQDWGGPIGISAVLAAPSRYSRLVVGNTWAWPSNRWTRSFSHVAGGRLTGWLLTQKVNFFVKDFLPRGIRTRHLTEGERAMYFGPFPTVDSRLPVMVFPREIRTAEPFLAGIERGLPAIQDMPLLLFWADQDIAFKESVRHRWQDAFPQRRDHTLEGSGHYWQDDMGEEAVTVIRDWYPTAPRG
jgi:haloalkane dehalogenase